MSIGHPWEYIEGPPWDFPLAYPRQDPRPKILVAWGPSWFCPWVRPRKQPCVRFWKYLWRSFNILPREPIENSSETHRDSSMPIVPVCWDSRHTAKYSYFFVTAETLNINTQQVLNIQRWIIGTLSIHTRHSQHPHSAHSASHSAVSAFTLGTCWVYSQQSQQMRWAETFSSVCCNSINPYPSQGPF